jgi:hypothetical protein
MKTFTRSALAFFIITLIGPSAFAGLKIDKTGLHEVESIALVGYSFFRRVEMEPASPFKLKPQEIELGPGDPEYQMMHSAADQIVEILQKTHSFELVSKETVFSNERYQALSKDPKKRWALNWYFPGEYRDLKKNKKHATALAKALDVDAVLWIHFKHAESSKSTSVLGAYKKEKGYIRLNGEITLLNRSGKQLISGSVKSRKMQRSVEQSVGAVGDLASGIEIDVHKGKPEADELWYPLIESYLINLEVELAK